MSQNEQYYLVPGQLTGEQETNMMSELLGVPILGPADMFARMVSIVGTPIQPCEDVKIAAVIRAPSSVTPTITRAIRRSLFPAGVDVELVRRTDMEAQVAVRDAEIARLLAKQPLYDRAVHENGELKLAVARLQAQEDKALTQVIEERDECERVISDLYHAAMGEYPEWSNNFGYRDAVEDVVDYVHALRTKALNGRALHE